MPSRLPRTARDVWRLSPKEWAIYNAVIYAARLTGRWRFPVAASGDFETMTRRDKIYWLYKAQFPVLRAVRGSGLEEHFERQGSFKCGTPPGFEAERRLQLSAVGDLMDHPYLPNSADSLYEDVADLILGADISMANLECVIDPAGSRAFVIRENEAPALCYTLAHFDVVKGFDGRKYSFMATASNHSLDRGEAGVAATMATLDSEDIAFNGTNESERAGYEATIIVRKGFRIAIVSHTFGVNGKKLPAGKPWMVNRTLLNAKLSEVDFARFERQIEFCRANDVDVIVAQLHWGLEHEYYPRPDQLAVARHLADIGVDIVIGHHPHVVQPTEYYRPQRDQERIVPIYYSLGNLVTPFTHPAFRASAVARVALSKGIARDGGTRTYVTSADRIELLLEIDERHRKLRVIRQSGRSGQ